MPEDDEDEYEDDGGNEMVDMEDDEAQPENDQLQNNKIVGGQGLPDQGSYDENRQPNIKKHFSAQNQQNNQANDQAKSQEDNAYQPNNGSGVDNMNDQANAINGFHAKQIQNHMGGGGRMRPQSAKTMPTAAEQ